MTINLDYLTSEWSGTPVFKRVAYFDICSLITLFLGSDTKNGKNFFAIRPITWNFILQLIYRVLPFETSRLGNPQTIMVFHQLHSIPFRPEQRRERVFAKEEKKITVGWHRNNPQLMRSSIKDMTTTPHRNCVGKAITRKGQMIVSISRAWPSTCHPELLR